jgi:hypothetical protein
LTTAADRLGAAMLLLLAGVSLAAAQEPAAPRITLAPRFAPGQSLRYQTEFRTISEARVSGALENPQGPSQVETSFAATVRLDVSALPQNSPPCEGCVRIRVTYEKVTAASRADVESPELAENEEQLKRLEGRFLEFTLLSDGRIREMPAAEGMLPAEQRNAEEWAAQLVTGSGASAEGVVPGQKWATERAVTPAPLEGVVWRAESTYLRNEPCRADAPAETCAVILTQFEIVQRETKDDPTPEEFKRRGLRTAGTIGGSGESLAYVSLATGWAVSVTQQAAEHTDLRVTAVDGSAPVRYTGRIRRQGSLTLLPAAAGPK